MVVVGNQEKSPTVSYLFFTGSNNYLRERMGDVKLQKNKPQKVEEFFCGPLSQGKNVEGITGL